MHCGKAREGEGTCFRSKSPLGRGARNNAFIDLDSLTDLTVLFSSVSFLQKRATNAVIIALSDELKLNFESETWQCKGEYVYIIYSIYIHICRGECCMVST